MPREGVLVAPYVRLNLEQVEQIHQASLSILTSPGIIFFNRSAAELFGDFGAEVIPAEPGEAGYGGITDGTEGGKAGSPGRE